MCQLSNIGFNFSRLELLNLDFNDIKDIPQVRSYAGQLKLQFVQMMLCLGAAPLISSGEVGLPSAG